MEMSPSLPAWASMNFSLCTNMPPEPQQGSYTLPWCGASTATSVFTMLRGV